MSLFMLKGKTFATRNKNESQTDDSVIPRKSEPRRVVVKEKLAVFIIALVLLALNLILLLRGTISYLEFLGFILVVGVGANVAYRLIDRNNKKQQAKK
jgi:hypothetical protein